MRSTANADPAAQANANTFKKKAMTEYILEQGGLVFDDFAVSQRYKFHKKAVFQKKKLKRRFKKIKSFILAVRCASPALGLPDFGHALPHAQVLDRAGQVRALC